MEPLQRNLLSSKIVYIADISCLRTTKTCKICTNELRRCEVGKIGCGSLFKFPSHLTEIAPKNKGVVKFEEIYFILLRIPPIVILSDREKMWKIWMESADQDPWTLPGPY